MSLRECQKPRLIQKRRNWLMSLRAQRSNLRFCLKLKAETASPSARSDMKFRRRFHELHTSPMIKVEQQSLLCPIKVNFDAPVMLFTKNPVKVKWKKKERKEVQKPKKRQGFPLHCRAIFKKTVAEKDLLKKQAQL